MKAFAEHVKHVIAEANTKDNERYLLFAELIVFLGNLTPRDKREADAIGDAINGLVVLQEITERNARTY